MSAERNQRGADAHIADEVHEAHHTRPERGEHGEHDKHAGHRVEMFRGRFWWSLLLTMPLVVTSHMVMDWFDYTLDFPGIAWVGPMLGTVLYVWGGWPFLTGGVREAKARQPGMMLLIAMAITIAYVASMATSLDVFDLDFWWELGALITIMLLGHWQEMKALGQAQDALAALAALLPDEADRITVDGSIETVPAGLSRVGELVLVHSGRPPRRGARRIRHPVRGRPQRSRPGTSGAATTRATTTPRPLARSSRPRTPRQRRFPATAPLGQPRMPAFLISALRVVHLCGPARPSRSAHHG